jgi:hypothetical protein
MRVAILSTPRSGNTWLRHMLALVFGAEELAVHRPDEIAWSRLPRACVLQLHWRRTAELEHDLRRHGFWPVVLARHPLDVLLSILHFATHDGATRHWLDGAGGGETSIHGAMPCSASFLDYACGPRAAALLDVSPEWQSATGAVLLRYEDMVVEPAQWLSRVVEAVGIVPRLPVAEAVAASTLPKMRQLNRARHHFWQGQPGLWKRLLTAECVTRIYAAQCGSFQSFGYDGAADPQLSRSQADASWIELTRAELTEKTWHYLATRQELEKAQQRLKVLQKAALHVEQRFAALEHALQEGDVSRGRRLLADARRQLTAALESDPAIPWKMRLVTLGRALARRLLPAR